MKDGKALGIYYLMYSDSPNKRFTKCIVAITKQDLFDKIAAKEVPDDYYGYFEECRTPGRLAYGQIHNIKAWAEKHMPDKFGDPLRD